MQLADIRTDIDPFRALLAGHMLHEDLARICSTMRNALPGVVRNDLLDEGLMGNLGKAAMLKSKAATLIPADLKKNPAIARLIDLAKQAETTVADDGMGKWWLAVGKAIGAVYKVDGKALVAAVVPKIKAEAEKLTTELQADQAETDKTRGRQDELTKLGGDLRHKKAIDKLRAKYGVSDEADPEAAAAKRKARAKTLAKLIGIEGDDLDPETLEQVIGLGDDDGDDNDAGRGSRGSRGGKRRKRGKQGDLLGRMTKLLKARAALSKKAAKAVPTEDAKKLLIGLAHMLISEGMLGEGPNWDAVKRFFGGLSMPLRYGYEAAALPFKGASAAYDDWNAGGEGHKKVGSGLLSLFSRQGRDQMGSNAVVGAIKSYLVAQAIASMVQAAKSMGATAGIKAEAGDDDDDEVPKPGGLDDATPEALGDAPGDASGSELGGAPGGASGGAPGGASGGASGSELGGAPGS